MKTTPDSPNRTVFGIHKRIINAVHYCMLFGMLHTTLVAPAQGIYLAYRTLKVASSNKGNLNLPLETAPAMSLAHKATVEPKYDSKKIIPAFVKSTLENTLIKETTANRLTTDLVEGVIGYSGQNRMDDPSDNVFKFNVVALPQNADKVFLKYDLYGVENQSAVARSINERFSIGGHLVKTNHQWTSQEEEIAPDWLKMGENTLLFTIPKGANYQYKIKNVRFEIQKGTPEAVNSLIVLEKNDITLVKDNQIYLKGFIKENHSANLRVEAEGVLLKESQGEFEGFVTLTPEMSLKKFLVVKAYDQMGLLGQEIVPLADQLIQADALYRIEEKKNANKMTLKAFEKSNFAIDGASIEIVDSALTQSKEISIAQLRTVDFAPLGSDVINVTKQGSAFRFLPDGTQFEKPVKITLEYDPSLLPKGYTAKDIKTFYFDTKNKRWQTVLVAGFDEEKKTITALTTHFTDYVNGIIQVPESPETNAYTPTSISGIKIANPGEKINLIQPPSANQEGDASLSYPIEIPSGRKGMQPNLAVNYNSAGGNGWMGQGWNLSTPSIELDTRWGAPVFDATNETEIYTLSGEQLLLKTASSFYLPNKSNPVARITDAFFYERVEGGFNKIQRKGNLTSNYYWLVTDKSGTIYTYGTTGAVLTNNAGKIVRWMLKKVQDINGNTMEYFYTVKAFTATDATNTGKQIYLQRIEYTKHATITVAPYSVIFKTATAVPKTGGTFTREDKAINARLGFKEITHDVLESIEVKYGTTIVRKYKFLYKQGQFKKTLLDKIQQYDGAGSLFNEHVLEYYDDTNNGQNIFGSEKVISGLSNDGGDLQGLLSTSLGASHTSSYSVGLGATVGFINSLLFFETLIPVSQSGTGGITGGISGSNTSGKITFLDIDGDGLPDKLFNSSSLGYRKNFGNNSFSAPISIPSMNEFTRSDSFSKSLGVRGNFTSGVFAGAERTWTNSYTNSYLEDVNGDGLIDVVKDRKVFFNSLNSSAIPTFTTLSSNTPNVIYQGLTTAPTVTTLTTPVLNNPPFDVVKVWRAPYTGTVTITGTVSLSTLPVSPADGVYFSIEKGNHLNEFPNPLETSTVSTNPISILTGFPVTLNATTSSKVINTSIAVTKGQRLYFRVNTISNDTNDLVHFNTNQLSIKYSTSISTVAAMPNSNQLDAEQISYATNSASDGFIVSAEQRISLPKNGSYTISYPAFSITNPTATGTTIPELSDEVQLLIEKHTRTIVVSPTDNSVVSDNDVVSLLNTTPTRIKTNTTNTISAFTTNDIVSSIDFDNADNSTTQVYYLFKIDGKSNVDWKKLSNLWQPKVVMPIPNNSVPGSTTTDVYPIPYLSIYNEKIRTTDPSTVITTNIDKFANYIIPPAMNTGTSTVRKVYQMQPIFPVVSGVNKFNSCTTCTSNTQVRKLYLTVKGSNKNLLFNNNNPANATILSASDQLTQLAKYEISIDSDGYILSTATGNTNSGIKRFNTTNGLYNINITGITGSTNPQSTLINIIFDAIDNGATTPSLIKNNRVYFEYFTDDIDIANSLANVTFGSTRIRAAATTTWTYANNTSTSAIYPNIFYKKAISDFGTNYRNWGQFAYKTEKSGSTTIALRESELIPNAPLTTTQQQNAQQAINSCGSASPPLSDSAYQTCVEEALYPPATNPLRRIFRLIPDAGVVGSNYYKRWKGTQTNMFVDDRLMSPKNRYDETVPTPTFVSPTITSSSEAFGIVKQTKSSSTSVTVGLGVGAFTNFGDNKVLNDHRDINGDNYPDFITETSLQLTNKLGNLFPVITSLGYRQDSNGMGWGTTVAGSIPKFNYVPKGSNGTTTNQTSNTGSGKDIGFNGSQTFSSDESKQVLLDINGDGLVDKVDVAGVNLNIGGSTSLFEGITNWNYGAVQKGNSLSVATGGGVNLFSGSVTLGLGIGTSTSPDPTNNNSETFQDMNGDGLVDKIENSSVRYNQGTTFSNTSVSIAGFDKTYQSISANASLNAGFTACFYFPIPVPIIPPFLFYLTGPKFCACGDGSLGYGINSDKVKIMDINGDGYPDIVSSNNENDLKVKYSNIGRTNMLKCVKRPLGATITIDYAVNNPIDGSKIGNTYKMPFSKWVMTSVVVNDGHSGDGEDNMINKFEYLEGVQDRRERTFLGFGIVKTHNMEVTGEVYRTLVTEYATNIPDTDLYVGALDNRIRQYFYKKGIVTKTYTLDNLARPRSQVEYFYKYFTPNIPVLNATLADYNMATTTPIAFPTATDNPLSFTDNCRVLPLLLQTLSKAWEYEGEYGGAPSHMKQQFSSIDLYDKYGNVKQFQDKGASLIDMADDIKVNMLYFYNANNVVNVVQEHRVTNQAVVYRLSRNFIDTLGRVKQIRKYLTTSLTTNYALYDVVYDAYGNITKITHPKGILSAPESSRMSYTYTYDTGTKTYVTNILDAYGYTNTTTYDFGLGVVKKSIDTNNAAIEYTYDSFGRTTSVKGPYQTTWTIQNKYYPSAPVPYATTAHFDDTGEIYTSTFIDGLQRVIQTKKELQNCNCPPGKDSYRFSISGNVYYDEFGRNVTNYLNKEEAGCANILLQRMSIFSVLTDDPNQLSMTGYDCLDRPTKIGVAGLYAGDAITYIRYQFGQDRDDATQFMKEITSPNGNITRTYIDSKGRNVASEQLSENESLWTSFEYNKINELVRVKDASEAITYYTYDNFGRKLSINHPDAGMATYKYDLASRLIESTNANLAALGQKVFYKYNINQLASIKYPSHTVDYKYGAVGAPNNSVGRVIYQSDLTGEQYFKYGLLGEVTENKRIVIDPLGAPREFITSSLYDTWGRIRALTYPDGEVVKYTYDKGGLLTNIKNTNGEVYLNSICYNESEQRLDMVYGNNTSTKYNYEPQQRLKEMTVKTPLNAAFMTNDYQYDLNGNVTQIQNYSDAIAWYHLGGTETKTFQYDSFNRLYHSEGNWHGELEDHQYTLDMEYNSMHNIVTKNQVHQTAPVGTTNYTDTANSFIYNYSYTGGSNQPHAPSTLDIIDPQTGVQSEQINNVYDLNGNLKSLSHDNIETGQPIGGKKFYWDEQNRLQAIIQDDIAYHYVYDASGERVLKSQGSQEQLVINGDQATTLNNPGTYTMYPSGYLVVGQRDYTKHYYNGSQRIASRMGDIRRVNYFYPPTALKQAKALETKKQVLQQQLATIYSQAGLATPNFTAVQTQAIEPEEEACINQIMALLEYYYNQPQTSDVVQCIKDISSNTTLTPCQRLEEISNSRCYIATPTTSQPIWWYHPDHLGSSSYLSDYFGKPSHYYNYLPFGEEMVSQNNSSYNNVYKFNGKELDEETGLYYYGARYYDPRISIWLSVDPLATHSKQVGTSPYAYVANNPVNLVDPTGMIWEDPKEAEKLNASINNRIKNVKSNTEKLQKEINTKKGKFLFFSYNLNEKQIAKREDKVAENGQKTELLNRSLADIEDIKNAPDTYRLTSPSGNNGLHGVFKGSDGVINIEGSNSGLHIHEMRHVGQSIEAGGVKFNESGWLLNPSTTYDGATENEVNAYQVQYSYDGSYPGQARSLKDINSTSLFDIKLDNGESVYKNLKKPKKK